jgi:NDP-sugar pyrophosphorylase family protein
MRAVVFAGGLGQRLRPHTELVPKPLLPVGGRPVLEILLRQLRVQGFRHVDLCVGHLSRLVRAHFGDGRALRLRIDYHEEAEPLGTIGPLRAIPGIRDDESVLAVNGDILADIDFTALVEIHERDGADATVCLMERNLTCDFGVVEIDESGLLATFVEKPASPVMVSIGVNVVRGAALSAITPGERIDVPDFMLRLKKRGKRVRCQPVEGLWLDIGRVEDYHAAQEIVARDPARFFADGGGSLATGAMVRQRGS